MTKTIVASDLTRYHGDLLAVDRVSFEVERGEIFGYLGPIAYLMPLTYAVDAMQQTVLGSPAPLTLLGDVIALSLFLVLFLGAATMALRKDIR